MAVAAAWNAVRAATQPSDQHVAVTGAAIIASRGYPNGRRSDDHVGAVGYTWEHDLHCTGGGRSAWRPRSDRRRRGRIRRGPRHQLRDFTIELPDIESASGSASLELSTGPHCALDND